jgi:anti-anti-sigma factor
MTARFELRARDAAPHATVELHGEVDATNASAFEDQLSARSSSGPVVLDLSRAAYLDSAGFEVLDRLVAAGAVIVVISPTSVIRRAAAVMSLPCHDTVDLALTEAGRTSE